MYTKIVQVKMKNKDKAKKKKKRQSTENFLFIQFYSFYHFKISFLKKLNTINGEGHVTHIGL